MKLDKEEATARLYRQLVEEAWNGNLANAAHLVANEFQVHVPGRDHARGIDALAGLITPARASFSTLQVSIAIGPVVQGDFVAARWLANGIYAGGIPGASAPAGTMIEFSGHDFLRLASDGRFSEYWGGADDGALLHQLGFFK